MPEEYRNIYKNARRAAGYTQETAAEQLGLSVESVRAYETGQRIPPNDGGADGDLLQRPAGWPISICMRPML